MHTGSLLMWLNVDNYMIETQFVVVVFCRKEGIKLCKGLLLARDSKRERLLPEAFLHLLHLGRGAFLPLVGVRLVIGYDICQADKTSNND